MTKFIFGPNVSPCFVLVDTVYFQFQCVNLTRIKHLWFLGTWDFQRIDLYELCDLLVVIFCYWSKLDKCKPIWKYERIDCLMLSFAKTSMRDFVQIPFSVTMIFTRTEIHLRWCRCSHFSSDFERFPKNQEKNIEKLGTNGVWTN